MTGLLNHFHDETRWLAILGWALLFVIVMFGPAWLATTAIVTAFCWVAYRQASRTRH
jgi:hypothetical protein